MNSEDMTQRLIEVAERYYHDTGGVFPAATQPAYVPVPTLLGGKVFAQRLLDRMYTPEVKRRASAAADAYEVQLNPNKTILQKRLFDVLREFLPKPWRPHPHNDTRARAAAEVLVAEIGPAAEREAFEATERQLQMSEFEWHEALARDREAKIARDQQRRRPLKPLYPV